MSYILDALRRAEAERERGSVPGLHSPGLPVGGAPPVLPTSRPARPAALLLAGAVALAVLAAVLGAWWARGPAPGPVPAPLPAAGGAPLSAHEGTDRLALADRPPSRATPAAVPSPVADLAPDASPEPLRLPTPPAAVKVAPHAPSAAPSAPPPAPPASPPQAPDPAGPQTRPPPPAAQRAAIAGSASPAIPLSALPPEMRAAWPPLAIGGSIYSDSPASRFIMANGQVVREGETAAPGVVVERIGRSAVVLLWRGLRVELPV